MLSAYRVKRGIEVQFVAQVEKGFFEQGQSQVGGHVDLHTQGQHGCGIVGRAVGHGRHITNVDALGDEKLGELMGHVGGVEANNIHRVAHGRFRRGGCFGA